MYSPSASLLSRFKFMVYMLRASAPFKRPRFRYLNIPPPPTLRPRLAVYYIADVDGLLFASFYMWDRHFLLHFSVSFTILAIPIHSAVFI
jgi:hypothetical protein